MPGKSSAASASPAPPPVAPERIRMIVGMEGERISRVPGDLLTVGDEVDGAEAWRLCAAGFAELVAA